MAHVEYGCPNCESVMYRSRTAVSSLDFKPLQTITCKNCLAQVPWFEMVRKYLRTQSLGGGDAAAGPLQTLFAVSGRASNLVNIQGATEIINTEAGTHDNNDATFDGVNWDSNGTQLGDGVLDCGYAMDTATAVGISFVRLVARVRVKFTISGLYSFTAGYGVDPTIGMFPISPIHLISSTTFSQIQSQRATDQGTGLPWTAAGINGYKWGYNLGGQNASTADDQIQQLEVAEFRVEIW